VQEYFWIVMEFCCACEMGFPRRALLGEVCFLGGALFGGEAGFLLCFGFLLRFSLRGTLSFSFLRFSSRRALSVFFAESNVVLSLLLGGMSSRIPGFEYGSDLLCGGFAW
jgi:hypothetical protein